MGANPYPASYCPYNSTDRVAVFEIVNAGANPARDLKAVGVIVAHETLNFKVEAQILYCL